MVLNSIFWLQFSGRQAALLALQRVRSTKTLIRLRGVSNGKRKEDV